jgi:hypothetical protein
VSAAARAWTAGLAASAVLCGLAACTTGAAQSLQRDSRTETRRLRLTEGGTRTVDVRTLSGSIRVMGDGGSDVRVEAVTRIEAETAEALQAALKDAVLDTKEQGATATIVARIGEQPVCGEQSDWRGPAWWDRRRYDASVSLTLQVPRDVRVRLCTVNGEEVTVSGVEGDFDVSNVNGKVRLEDMRGSGRATTVNGGIEATFASAPRGESLFKTVNGAIAATFPRDLSASLRLKTFNGEVYTDFDTTALPVTPEPARRPGVPRHVYRTRGFTNVRVGAGGPVLTFDTLNGDVRILRGSR